DPTAQVFELLADRVCAETSAVTTHETERIAGSTGSLPLEVLDCGRKNDGVRNVFRCPLELEIMGRDQHVRCERYDVHRGSDLTEKRGQSGRFLVFRLHQLNLDAGQQFRKVLAGLATP